MDTATSSNFTWTPSNTATDLATNAITGSATKNLGDQELGGAVLTECRPRTDSCTAPREAVFPFARAG